MRIGTGSRSQLNMLSGLLDLLSNPDKVKAHIDDLKAAAKRHDKAKADAAAAISAMSRKETELKKKEDQASERQNAVARLDEEIRRRQEAFDAEKRATEVDHGNREKKLSEAEKAHAKLVATNKASHTGALADLERHELEMHQAARALNERAARLAQREKALADKEADLDNRLAELRRLAG